MCIDLRTLVASRGHLRLQDASLTCPGLRVLALNFFPYDSFVASSPRLHASFLVSVGHSSPLYPNRWDCSMMLYTVKNCMLHNDT